MSAFEESKGKSIVELCREAGVVPTELTRNTYLYLDTEGVLKATQKPMRDTTPGDEDVSFGYVEKWGPLSEIKLMLESEEESINVLAGDFGINYNTFLRAVQDGRIIARKSGAVWLTTRTAVEYALKEGKLRDKRGE